MYYIRIKNGHEWKKMVRSCGIVILEVENYVVWNNIEGKEGAALGKCW